MPYRHAESVFSDWTAIVFDGLASLLGTIGRHAGPRQQFERSGIAEGVVRDERFP